MGCGRRQAAAKGEATGGGAGGVRGPAAAANTKTATVLAGYQLARILFRNSCQRQPA